MGTLVRQVAFSFTEGRQVLGIRHPCAHVWFAPANSETEHFAEFLHQCFYNNDQHSLLSFQEAKKCKEGESIRKCPRCSSPARVHDVQERAWCSSEKCKFDFCIKCNLQFHGAKDCALPSPTKNTKKTKKDNIIGSKTSKKKLRRL